MRGPAWTLLLLGLVLLWGLWRPEAPQTPPALPAPNPNPVAVSDTFWSGAALVDKPSARLVACRVLKVMDGDTLSCDLNGNGKADPPLERIRMLGVDAPETKRSPKNKTGRSQPYAEQAKHWLQQQVSRQTVWLAYDRRPTDKYGRTLAWVYTSPQATVSLNEQLVQQGLARVLILPPNRWGSHRLNEAAEAARSASRGLWR